MFLRRPTDDGINIGQCYSIFQKCVRRCLIAQALYYGNLIYKFGSPNSLKKRIIQCILEDMCHLNLALQVFQDNDEYDTLMKYIKLISSNKKTHISAYAQRIALYYNVTQQELDDKEMKMLEKISHYDVGKKYKKIREFLGDHNKLYTYMNKERLVWAVKILFAYRRELRYEIDEDVLKKSIKPIKFNEMPSWTKDKHTVGGTRGYQFFFEQGLVMSNMIYDKDPYRDECLKIYLDEESKFGRKARTKHTIERLRNTENVYKLMVSGFDDVIQVQLLTRRNFPKVYFARKKSNNYVLKGPLDDKMVNNIKHTEKIKIKLKCPHTNVNFIKILDETWMICDNLVEYDDKYIIKKSKLESNRKIYDGKKNICDMDPNNNFINIMKAVLLKNVVGASDFAKRNFIEVGRKVYSIDDHYSNGKIMLAPRLEKNKLILWNQQIIKYRKDIVKILHKWYNILKMDRIKEIIEEINVMYDRSCIE